MLGSPRSAPPADLFSKPSTGWKGNGTTLNGALATVRIVTCRTPSGSVDLMPATLKMPWGAVADNMAQGGLVAPVDPTGHIAVPSLLQGRKTRGQKVDAHPDTGTRLEGFEIPFWREVVGLSMAAHAAFASMFFIGWDIAILNDGPVILEGNPLWDADVILLAHRITLADTQLCRTGFTTTTRLHKPFVRVGSLHNQLLAAVVVWLATLLISLYLALANDIPHTGKHNERWI